MDLILQQLINGLSLGSIYALIALGYTMVYGIIQLINFAHGDVLMVGAYAGFAGMVLLHLDPFTSLLAAMIICAILGMLIERLAYKPLRHSTRIAVLITAIGMSLLIEYVTMYFVGAEARAYPAQTGWLGASYHFGGVNLSMIQIIIVVVSVILMVVLQFIIKKTRIGKAMRAVSQDQDAAKLMGISVDNTISFTFALGSALAGAAGVLWGLYYTSITPLMGIMPGLKAFVAAVLGGIGLIPGALVGGYLVGLLETIVNSLGLSTFRDAAVFLVLIIVLIFKPAGILGKNVQEKV
ncbi:MULTISPECIES: branched-chain amino acid ABC transporter permease [Mobiluncus]|uniref:Branched-chain amino acid ABC transporter, permease protein n=2 Tax=Mobiluncus TaxID=2050 RepID=E6M1M5_9ACTO|nr:MULTISPECIES: branched-chain amino acid ABC transporter permease [Mobiluncus]EFL93185.1 branched-chain amino acid ABC transporter, permease protein [Mobiluncus curtisii subsp. curtisii ATCC 35241]EFU82770.1 branched-chain amino acid ABC transporter, permease protein [Mobiluncus holmesii ATCC 35242]MCU9986813.1 branched-chain amino acid ABC transporter permease [Mobiluncus curtisii]MCU9999714.1 branched-chain amino acid ABC transporter permease [Mobiluncus curtisii]MCV0019950.1 branched-chai